MTGFRGLPEMTMAADPADLWAAGDAYRTPLADYLAAKAGQAFEEFSSTGMAINEARLADGYDPRLTAGLDRALGRETPPPPTLSREDWTASDHYREKIDYTPSMTEAKARAMAEIHDRRELRAWLIDHREPGVLSGVLGFGAMMVGGLPAVENFLPVIGPATRAALAVRFGAVAGRAMAGAAENAVVTAAIEPFIAMHGSQFGDDMTLAEALLDIGVGAALGGVLGGAGGLYHKYRGEPLAHRPGTVSATEGVLARAMDTLAEDGQVDITPGLLDTVARDAAILSEPGAVGRGEIFADVRDQAKAAGLSDAEADANAAIWQAMTTVLGERAGRDPLELYQSLGLEIRRGEVPGTADLYLQPAYHGSPHRSETFSIDAIGTGEGAQVYGWGLYFAQRRDVAEQYREVLSSKAITIDGQSIDAFFPVKLSAQTRQRFREHWERAAAKGGTTREIARRANQTLNDKADGFKLSSGLARSYYDAANLAGEIASRAKSVEIDRGQVYRVEVPDDHEMLDWNALWSEQPEHVRAALADLAPDRTVAWREISRGGVNVERFQLLIGGELAGHVRRINGGTASERFEVEVWQRGGFETVHDRVASLDEAKALVEARTDVRPRDTPGMEIYAELRRRLGSPEAASRWLNERGVKGLRYLDQGSRADGDGTYNFVVFDDSAVKVTETYYQTVPLRRGTRTLAPYGVKPGEPVSVRETATALEAMTRKKWGTITRDDRSPEARSRIAGWMVDEIVYELGKNDQRSAVGWYGPEFQAALDKLAEIFPELKTDRNARDAMTAIIAVTSDGQEVVTNFSAAAEIYGQWRETGKIPSDTTLGGERAKNIAANLAVIDGMLAKHGPEGMRNYLLAERTVSEHRKILGDKNAGKDFLVDEVVPMSALIFGPKLGSFYANLMGRHHFLTMDRWWSRLFNRMRGTLVKAPSKQGLQRFREMLGQPDLTDEQTIQATIPYRNAYKEKSYKNGTEIETAANTIYKAAFEQLEDQPFGGGDRRFMIDAAKDAQRRLKRRGYNLTIDDIQAVLWYYEKRLYGEFTGTRVTDVSYREAAQAVAAERAGAGGDRRERPGSELVREPAAGGEAGAARPVDGNVLPGEGETAGEGEPAGGVARPPDTFYQPDVPEAGGARAAVELGDGIARITLAAKADASSLAHESAHVFLKVLHMLGTAEDADPGLARDWGTIRDAIGAEDGVPLTRDQHEAFTGMWERYLAEGRAPSVELEGVFSRFKQWMLEIYRSLKAVNAEISPDVRAVFDRMLASEEQIAAARRRDPGIGPDALAGEISPPGPAPRGEATPAELAAEHGVGLDGSHDAELDLEIVTQRGLLDEEVAELAAADDLVARAAIYDQAYRAAAACLGGASVTYGQSPSLRSVYFARAVWTARPLRRLCGPRRLQDFSMKVHRGAAEGLSSKEGS